MRILPAADDSSGWYQPARRVPKKSCSSVSYRKHVSLTRLVCLINSRHQQESSKKVVHKFTEFTRPAPARHQRDTKIVSQGNDIRWRELQTQIRHQAGIGPAFPVRLQSSIQLRHQSSSTILAAHSG